MQSQLTGGMGYVMSVVRQPAPDAEVPFGGAVVTRMGGVA